jgi:hypothetical protein
MALNLFENFGSWDTNRGIGANLDFLTKDNPDMVKVYPVFTSLDDSRSDVRRAIIRYMEGL